MEMEEILDRYQHLLQPARDLEQNWSIDVAEELNEAILALSQQSIDFGQAGDKIIDFGKAALLIQGGAHVYSKKVDYLYKTVHDLKAWMGHLWEDQKKKGTSRNNAGEENHAGGDGDQDEFELSDVDINEDDDCTLINEGDLDTDHIQGSVLLHPKPTVSVTDHLVTKVPLLSVKGEVIGYLHEFGLSAVDPEAFWDIADARTEDSEQRCDEQTADEPDSELTSPNRSPLDSCQASAAKVEYANGSITESPVAIKSPQKHVIRQLRPRSKVAALSSQKIKKEEVDPWSQVMDAYELSTNKPKPLKPKKCQLLPGSVQKRSKRKSDGKSAPIVNEDIASFCNREFSRNAKLHADLAGGDMLLPELKYKYASQLADQCKQLKILKVQLQRLPISDEDLLNAHNNSDDDDEGDISYNDNAADERSDLSDNDQDLPAHDLEGDALTDMNMPLTSNTVLSSAVQEQINRCAYDDEKLSDIDKKVKVWQDNIKKSLDQAESRPVFDMHQYSESIFNSFSDQGDKVSFDSILQGKPKFEAFRTFVSTLILANHGNIDIQHDKQANNVQLALVHKTKFTEVMDSTSKKE